MADPFGQATVWNACWNCKGQVKLHFQGLQKKYISIHVVYRDGIKKSFVTCIFDNFWYYLQDLCDRNITIYLTPGSGDVKWIFHNFLFWDIEKNHDNRINCTEFSERIHIAKSWDAFNNITKYNLLEKESVYNLHATES